MRNQEQEFIEHLQNAQTRLYSYVHMLVQNVNDADDVLQQTTLILWRKFEEYDRERSFLSWACGIARFEAFNHLRKHKRNVVKLSDQIDILLVESLGEVSSTEYDQRREALPKCIQRLNEADRSLLHQHYAHSKTVRQIAEGLDRTPQSVHNSLKRIRNALLSCIRSTLSQEAF